MSGGGDDEMKREGGQTTDDAEELKMKYRRKGGKYAGMLARVAARLGYSCSVFFFIWNFVQKQ